MRSKYDSGVFVTLQSAFLLRSWLYLVTCGFNTYLVKREADALNPAAGTHSSMLLEYIHDTTAASHCFYSMLKHVSIIAAVFISTET